MIRPTTLTLIVSLILNIFFIGLGLGVVVTGARLTTASPPRPRAATIWVAAAALPQPDQFKFRSMLRQSAQSVQPLLNAARVARQQAAGLMAQPSLDGKAVSQALETARTNEQAARAGFDQAIIAYLQTMPAEERATVAQAMARSGARQVRQSIRDEAGQAPAPAPLSAPHAP